MKKMLFLFNPYAGRCKITHSLSKILSIFEKAGYEVTVYQIQATGDGEEKIQREAGCYDRIVVVGGDGMLHEVVNAILKLPTPIAIGYIPTGTVNDFATTYGLPTNPESAAEIAVSSQLQWIDAGNVNNYCFSYVAAFGFATDVAYTTEQKAKNKWGKLAYSVNALKYMNPAKMKLSCKSMVIEYGNIMLTGEFVFGAISNSLSIAGMKNLISDDVELDDGLLEGIFIKKPKSASELIQIIRGVLFRDLTASCFFHLRADHIIIHSQPTAWTVDGEYGGIWDSAEIRTITKGICLAVPQK